MKNVPSRWRSNWFRGFAASRAESLRLSVKAATGLAATPHEAKPLLILETKGKPEAFRTGGGKAAKRQICIWQLEIGDVLTASFLA